MALPSEAPAPRRQRNVDRQWLVLCALSLLVGFFLGWVQSYRTETMRAMTAAIRRDQAERKYYDKRIEQMIREEKGDR